MNSQTFANVFGPIARAFAFVKRPLHAISFMLGCLYFSFIGLGQLKVLGLDSVWGAGLLVTVFTLGAALLVEYLHFYVPSIFFRLLFTMRSWFNTFRPWLMFLLLGGLLAGLTWFSQHTSSQGAVMGVDQMQETTAAPQRDSLTLERNQYQTDSAALASQYDELLSAERAAMQASKDSAAAPYDAEIASFTAALRGHKMDKAKGNSWAQSWIDKRLKQIANAKAAKVNAKNKAAISHQNRIAEIQREKASILIKRTAAWNDLQGQALEDHKQAKASFVEMFDNRRRAGSGVGWWVVLMIVVLDFLIIFYEVGSGREYVGAEWKPSNKLGKWLGAVGGIFIDKVDHLYARTDATRHHLRKRPQAKPFTLPSARIFARSASLVFLAFAAFQLPEIAVGSFEEFSVVPHPYNWLLALVAVSAVVMAFYDYKKSALIQHKASTNSAQSQDQVSDSAPAPTSDFSIYKSAESRMAATIQQKVSNSSPPPAMTANPNQGGRLNDDWNAYRKRVYGWWRTAHDRKKSEETRSRNLARCQAAFPKFEAVGCTVEVKGKKLSIKANG